MTISCFGFIYEGHPFYAMQIDTTVTYVYDDITGEWAEFVTDGANYWQANDGSYWNGYNVMGGYTSSYLYYLDPTADNDDDDGSGNTVDVTHIVTGLLTSRGRVARPIDAVFLSASVGGAAATVNFRFSDDNGNNWSGTLSRSLTSGDYDQEIAYRALGAMRAPGRLFEISDTGGSVRINGLDVQMR